MLLKMYALGVLSSFVHACSYECLRTCVGQDCPELCECSDESFSKVQLEDGQEYLVRQPNSSDKSLHVSGCDVACSQTCLKFSHSFGLLTCQEYCGCKDLVFKVNTEESQHDTLTTGQSSSPLQPKESSSQSESSPDKGTPVPAEVPASSEAPDEVLSEPLAPADLARSGPPQRDPLAAPEAVQQVTAFGFIPRSFLGCEGQCEVLCSNLAQDDSCLKTCNATFCMEVPPTPSHGYQWVLTAVLLSVACLIYWGLHNLGKKHLMPYQEELSGYYRLRD